MPLIIDGPNLVVTLESGAGSPFFGARSANVQIELYSYWKTWVLLSDNAKYPAMFRTIGGDDLGGGLEAGDYYFLQNQFTSSGSPIQQGGWRIKPPEEDIIYTLVGNLFAQDPDLDIFSVTDGDFNTSIRLQTSSLTQTVITDQMITIESKIDVVDTNVDLILIDTGSILGTVLSTERTVGKTVEKLSEVQETIEDTKTTVNVIEDQTANTEIVVQQIEDKVDIIQIDVTNIFEAVDDLIKYSANRTRIDPILFTLTVYEEDKVTPLRVYDLKDENGVASVTTIFERDPQVGFPFSSDFSADFL